MRRDRELLDEREPVARVYTWDRPWISLGNSQIRERVLRPDAAVPWVSRPTGGWAVLHGHDLTIGLAMPLEPSVRKAYRVAVSPIVEALCHCGIPCDLAEKAPSQPETARAGEDCFAMAGKCDIVSLSTMRKVAGCALRRTREAVLVQVSIPVTEPAVSAEALIVGGVRESWISVRSHDLAEALRETLRNQFGSTHRLG